MLYRVLFAACVFALVAAPLTAHADAYGDLRTAMAAFNAVHSFHAVERTSGGHTILVDYAAPNRWRIQPTPEVNEVLIGDTIYMNGRPLPPLAGLGVQSALASVRATGMSSAEVKKSARDLGWQSLGGVRVHVYSFTSKGVPTTLYLGPNHLPLQAVVKTDRGTTVITYSRYNAPIAITP